MTKAQPVQLYPIPEGTLVVLDQESSYDAVLAALGQVIEERGDRFAGSNVVIDVGDRNLSTRELLELEELVNRGLGTRVLQIVNNEAAEILKELGARGPLQGGTASDGASRAREAVAPSATSDEASQSGAVAVRRWAEQACLLRRTVRSGQRITYDGSLVILGDVNPGAEVIATGDVIVVGALRGVAHAGARGDIRTCIVALRFCPVQIRIAHLIGRAPDDSPEGEVPEVAFVREGQIVVETLASRPDVAFWRGGNALWVERL